MMQERLLHLSLHTSKQQRLCFELVSYILLNITVFTFSIQDQVVQSIVSLTSSLEIKMLTVNSSKYNIKFTVIFAEKMW